MSQVNRLSSNLEQRQ